jgi:hypothetical protein
MKLAARASGVDLNTLNVGCGSRSSLRHTGARAGKPWSKPRLGRCQAEIPAADDRIFTNQKELAKVTADWPASRLVNTRNGFRHRHTAANCGRAICSAVALIPSRHIISRVWDCANRRLKR